MEGVGESRERCKEVMGRMSDILLGIDLGTTQLKASIYDLEGNKISEASRGVPMQRPHPGWAQQNPELWWNQLKSVIKQILSQRDISGEQIKGVGVCGQSSGPIPIGRDGMSLGPCITWLDHRSTKQVEWILKNVGEEKILKITGSYVDNAFAAAKFLWIKENWPDIFEKAEKFLFPKDFLVFRLTGSYSTDCTEASVTNMFDVQEEAWSKDLLEDFEIPREKLPEVNRPWELVGQVTEKASKETGLQKGTPVIAGGGDWACTFYGAGFVKPGRAVDVTGTVGYIAVAGEGNGETSGLVNVVPGLKTVGMAGSQAATAIYDWYKNEFYWPDELLLERANLRALEVFDNILGNVPPGSGGVIVTPNFVGQRRPKETRSKGVIFGLTLETKREQIMRAIMEGLAYEMRRGLESLPNKRDISFEEIRAIGGGGRSRVWRQIKADILNVPYCQINIDEGGTFGVAVLAGVGVGFFSDLISPIERIVKVIERQEPRKKYRAIYDNLYQIYVKLNTLLENSGIYADFSEIEL